MTDEEILRQDEIRNNVKYVGQKIKEMQEWIESEQLKCKHPRTFEGKYSWRVGCIDDALICFDCGKLIKIIHA